MKSLKFARRFLLGFVFIMLQNVTLQSATPPDNAAIVLKVRVLRMQLKQCEGLIRSSPCARVQSYVGRGTRLVTHLLFFTPFYKVFSEPETSVALKVIAIIPGVCPTIGLVYAGRKKCKSYMRRQDSLLKLKYRAICAQQWLRRNGRQAGSAHKMQLTSSVKWFLEDGGYEKARLVLMDKLFFS